MMFLRMAAVALLRCGAGSVVAMSPSHVVSEHSVVGEDASIESSGSGIKLFERFLAEPSQCQPLRIIGGFFLTLPHGEEHLI
jgi:hypothetical protein